MTGGRRGSPQRLTRAFRWLLPGVMGAEACDELVREYNVLRQRYTGPIAWLWYFAHLFRPSTWALARELRRAERVGRGRAGFPVQARGVGTSVSLLDVRLGVRMLRRQPMLTGVAVLALGVGIPTGLSTTHLIDTLMVPLPFEDGARIMGIRSWDLETHRSNPRVLHDFAVWREELTTFQVVAAARSEPWNVHSEDGRAEPVRGAEITASAFDILRVPPLLGRTLAALDEVIGAPDVVVVGADIWESRFGGDPEIVGKTIRIGGVPHTVVGVMPEGFLFPLNDHLWLPLRANPTDYQRGEGPDLLVFGRLSDGVSLEQAGAEVETVGRRMAAEYPDTHARLQAQVVTMPLLLLRWRADIRTDPEFYLLQLMSFVLLMIVCGNVGVMILAQTASRSGEIAIRTALGASRARIVSQLLVETLLLTLFATGLGLLAANWVAHQFRTLLVGELLPYWVDFGLGLRSVLLALGLGVFCAVVASLVPALKATGRGVQSNLQRSAGGGSAIRFGLGSSALIVIQVALSVGLLSYGAAQLRSVLQDTTGEMGIELEHYLSAQLQIPWVDPTLDRADTHLDEFWHHVSATRLELKRRIESEPGVGSVAMGRDLPGMDHRHQSFEIDGDATSGSAGIARVAEATVDVNFFRDLGRPILKGRDFDSGDIPDERGAHRAAVVVNTSFVDQVLGGQRPIGRRIRPTTRTEDPIPWYEIVGVVGRLGMNPLNPARDAGVYHPAGPREIHPVGFVIELRENAADFTPRLRAISAEVDPMALIQRPMLLSKLADSPKNLSELADVMLQEGSAGAVRAAALNHKGYATYQLGDEVEGTRLVRQALESDSLYAGAHFNWARILAQEGSVDLAMEFLKTAVGMDSQYRQIARSVRGLESLRQRAEFQDLIGR